MRPSSIVLLASSSCLFFGAAPAWAQECPEGDWFCEPAFEPPPDPPEEVEPEPPATERTRRKRPPKVARWRAPFLPEQPPPPKARQRLPRREWAFDIHLLASLMGREAHPDAGMGGIGFGLRYRPISHFALDGTLELAFGNDYNGDERSETGFLVNAVGFLNPKSRVQAFVLAGLGVSVAEVKRDSYYELPFTAFEERYSYFGMQLGGGIEARLSRRAALRFDVLGFVRGRTDDDHRLNPEFVDPATNSATNTSGGGLLRAGALFYW